MLKVKKGMEIEQREGKEERPGVDATKELGLCYADFNCTNIIRSFVQGDPTAESTGSTREKVLCSCVVTRD